MLLYGRRFFIVYTTVWSCTTGGKWPCCRALGIQSRDALLYNQLHAGLKLTLVEGPAVSGSLTYMQLCLAAKQEEQRLADLRCHKLYFERPYTGHEPNLCGELFIPISNLKCSFQPSDIV